MKKVSIEYPAWVEKPSKAERKNTENELTENIRTELKRIAIDIADIEIAELLRRHHVHTKILDISHEDQPGKLGVGINYRVQDAKEHLTNFQICHVINGISNENRLSFANLLAHDFLKDYIETELILDDNPPKNIMTSVDEDYPGELQQLHTQIKTGTFAQTNAATK